MYQKAVQTESTWAFAYEVPMGGYALSLSYPGTIPILEDEPEFARREELEAEMRCIAPLSWWSKKCFVQLIRKQQRDNPSARALTQHRA